MGAPPNTSSPWLVKGILAILGITAVGAGVWYMSSTMQLASTTQIKWSSTTDPAGAADVGIVRNTTAGVLKVTNGSTAHGVLEAGKDGIATTSSDGIFCSNDTAAVVGTTVQYSPRIRQRAQVWDTDGSNDTFDWWTEVVPASASTTTSSFFVRSSKNSAAATDVLTLTNTGSALVNSTLTAGSMISSTYIRMNSNGLTAGTMSSSAPNRVASTWHQYTWTNAMVVAAGDTVTTFDVTVATLPAKTRVMQAYIVISTAATNMGAATLTAQLGTDATFSNYLAAGSMLAAANTVYGDANAECGASLPGGGLYVGHLPSWTATTDVKVRFITDGAGGKDLADVLTCTGSVYLLTETLP